MLGTNLRIQGSLSISRWWKRHWRWWNRQPVQWGSQHSRFISSHVCVSYSWVACTARYATATGPTWNWVPDQSTRAADCYCLENWTQWQDKCMMLRTCLVLWQHRKRLRIHRSQRWTTKRRKRWVAKKTVSIPLAYLPGAYLSFKRNDCLVRGINPLGRMLNFHFSPSPSWHPFLLVLTLSVILPMQLLWLQQSMKRFSFALKAHTLVLQVKASSDLKP